MDFNWKVRVYYEDTDAGGVVYHARYLAFLERARSEMLRALNIEQHTLLAQNLAFVVNRIAVDYLFPAKLDDELIVKTELVKVKGASLQFIQQIVNLQEQAIIRAEVGVVMVNTVKMKPIRIPAHIYRGLYRG